MITGTASTRIWFRSSMLIRDPAEEEKTRRRALERRQLLSRGGEANMGSKGKDCHSFVPGLFPTMYGRRVAASAAEGPALILNNERSVRRRGVGEGRAPSAR